MINRVFKSLSVISDVTWGYRFLLRFEYPDASMRVNLFPSFSFCHDAEGHSPPPTFIEDRLAFNLGLGAVYLNRYSVRISYTVFDGANFDDFEDRDFASLSFGISFQFKQGDNIMKESIIIGDN